MTLTVGLQYFIQHGYRVIMLNFVARSHFSFIGCMFYDGSMFIEHCNKTNNISVLFIVCVNIADHYWVKILDKFQSKIQIPNVFKSNLNSNFKAKVRLFELCLTSLNDTLESRHEPLTERFLRWKLYGNCLAYTITYSYDIQTSSSWFAYWLKASDCNNTVVIGAWC